MNRFLPYLILAALVWVAYGNTLQHSFHYDDVPQILEKPWVRGLEKIPEFITNPLIRPLVILSFNLNYALSGFDVWSYHAVNIMIHLCVVWMVYRLVLLTGKGSVREGIAPPAFKRLAFVSAALFALHPLNTQTVTYISSRSSSLCALFYLIAMELFFRGMLKKKESSKNASASFWFLGAFGALILGGLSKMIIITIPAMLFLYHFYFFSGQSFGQWLKRQAGWLVAVGLPLFGFILFRMFSEKGILPTGQTFLTSSQYFLTQTFVIPFEYFKKMLFPINLSIEVHHTLYSDWSVLSNYLGIAALLLFVLLLIRVSRNRPWIGFGLAWMGITILPTSSFVPLHDVAVEHRTYLPLIGFCIAAAAVMERWMSRLHRIKPGYEKWAGRFTALVLILFAVLLVGRNGVWKDELTLWADAKKKAPHLVRPYNNLGETYDKLGQYEKAIAEFKEAIAIDPNYVFSLNNLGNVYGKLQQFRLASEYFERVLALDATYAPAHYNLGRAQQALKKNEEALKSYRHAFEQVPYFEEAIFNFATLATQLGRLEEGIVQFKRYIEYYPQNYQGYFGLGNAYMRQGKFDDAIAQYGKSAAINPKYLLAYINQATAQMQAGQVDNAIATYNEILKRAPGIAGVHKNLGLIYAQHRPDPAKSIFHFEESLRLEPNQPQAAILRQAIEDFKRQLSSSDIQ